MEIMIKILGILAYLFIGGTILCFAYAFAVDETKALIAKFVREAKQNTRFQIAQELRRDCYWYSEDPRSMEAIRSIADLVELTNDIGACRENWRNTIKNNLNKGDQ